MAELVVMLAEGPSATGGILCDSRGGEKKKREFSAFFNHPKKEGNSVSVEVKISDACRYLPRLKKLRGYKGNEMKKFNGGGTGSRMGFHRKKETAWKDFPFPERGIVREKKNTKKNVTWSKAYSSREKNGAREKEGASFTIPNKEESFSNL